MLGPTADNHAHYETARRPTLLPTTPRTEVHMLVLPSMIAEAAEKAGISLPPGDKIDHDANHPEGWSGDEYPHFHLFCCAQLGRPMSAGAHWENAKVIAAIPESELRTVTYEDLDRMGWTE